MENYSVTQAQMIIPAADLSEQISTAGMEASGTGNMKFALNGALTIGTLDGANIEIREEVGENNIFIFGLTDEEVQKHRQSNHDPWKYYNQNPELKQAIDMIKSGYFSSSEPALFHPIIDSLFRGNDYYMVLADYDAYLNCQETVNQAYRDPRQWTKMSIINVAKMGKFSSDRTIKQYSEEIWNVKPMPISLSHE